MIGQPNGNHLSRNGQRILSFTANMYSFANMLLQFTQLAGEPNFDSNSRGNNKWMTSRLGGSKGFDECTEILQHHHGEEVIVLDTLVCLFAKFTPQIPILDELERSLCTPLRVINNIAVTPVDDLGA